jgi:hypothetical protein
MLLIKKEKLRASSASHVVVYVFDQLKQINTKNSIEFHSFFFNSETF